MIERIVAEGVNPAVSAAAAADYVGPGDPPPAIGGVLPIPGDIVIDDLVDIFDLVKVAVAFGAVPGDGNWDRIADIVYDGLIDIFDVVTVATHFGEYNDLWK